MDFPTKEEKCSKFAPCNDSDSEDEMSVKRIAVYGGSFNPPTQSHMQLIEIVANKTNYFNEVQVVPCGQREDKPDMIEGDV